MDTSNRRLLILGAALLAALMTAGCGRKEEPERAPVARPIKTLRITGGGEGRLTFPGTVQAMDRAELSFRVNGPLVELPVNEGDEVKKGQLLARLDPRDYEIAAAEAQAVFEKSEADLARYQRLYEQEAVPLADLELARAQRDMSKARYDQARADVRDTRLVAPFDGWVGRRFVQNFEDVQAKERILTLHNIENLEIVVDVAEGLVARVKKVQGIYVRFSAAPEEEFPLTLQEFSAEADPKTRTYQVTLSFPQPKNIRVLPGMTGTVVAVNPEAMGQDQGGTFVVPVSAVGGGDSGTPYVWIVDEEGMFVTRRDVRVGSVTGTDGIQILEGLTGGETIALTGVTQLTEGAQVRLMNERGQVK